MLSTRLKELRKKNGITQIDFAKAFNISTGTIGNWETGAREPDTQTLLKIANYFGVTVDYLLGENVDPDKPSKKELDDSDIKVALFGGDGEVTDEMWDEVRNFVDYVKSKHSKGGK